MSDLGNLNKRMLPSLEAVRQMQEVQRSVGRLLDIASIQPTIPGGIPFEIQAQAALRDALAANRLAVASAPRLPRLAVPAWSAVESVTRLMESLRPAREMTEAAARAAQGWLDRLGPLDRWSQAAFPMPALEAHLADVARVAEVSRLLAARLLPEGLGRTLAISPADHAGLVCRFEELTGAYGNFYASVGESEVAVLTLPPALTAQPATEYFNAADLLGTTTDEAVEPELEAEVEVTRAEIAEETRDSLTAALAGRYPDLVEPLEGARAALTGMRPDYARHSITSLRELVTHLLHRLAPDHAIKAWSDAADDYSKGRPTRAARLRYICRGVAQGRFTDFVKKDVTDMLAVIDLFQGGTHEVISSYNRLQLRAILARTEGMLHFLLAITET